jgi:hypothetical protein
MLFTGGTAAEFTEAEDTLPRKTGQPCSWHYEHSRTSFSVTGAEAIWPDGELSFQFALPVQVNLARQPLATLESRFSQKVSKIFLRSSAMPFTLCNPSVANITQATFAPAAPDPGGAAIQISRPGLMLTVVPRNAAQPSALAGIPRAPAP